MITVWAPDGVGEVRRGARLADLLLPLVDLAEGDVVCVTSKVVSKAEGRASPGTGPRPWRARPAAWWPGADRSRSW